MNNSDPALRFNHLLSTCTTPQIPPGIINDELQEKVYASCLLIYRTDFRERPENGTDALHWRDHS
jgi:hypothetical protein